MSEGFETALSIFSLAVGVGSIVGLMLPTLILNYFAPVIVAEPNLFIRNTEILSGAIAGVWLYVLVARQLKTKGKRR